MDLLGAAMAKAEGEEEEEGGTGGGGGVPFLEVATAAVGVAQ